MAKSVEAELKVELVQSDLTRLKQAPAIADLQVGPTEVLSLSTTYWDTPDQALRKSGATLRIRRTGGALEQTVKTGGSDTAFLAERSEYNVTVGEERPDLSAIADADLRARLVETIGDAPLEPLFTLAMERTSRLLVTKAGDEVEFVLDEGTVSAGPKSEPVLEAEFELKSGDPRALFATARLALDGVPVRFSRTVKSERGYRLLDGTSEAAWKPVKAVEAEIDPDDTVEVALREILRSCLKQIAANAAAVQDGPDPEGPHQLRVGLRRLRSVLSVFRPVLEPTATARLVEDVRWLAGLVGELRDLDVLVDEIIAPCSGHFDTSTLRAAVEARRVKQRASVVETLRGARANGFLLELAAYTETRGWLSSTDLDQSAALSKPFGSFARAKLTKVWTKVAKMGRRAEDLDGEERHDLRKAFKKLRYAIEFFEPALDRQQVKRILKDIKQAQELLGYLNDVRMAASLSDLIHAEPGFARKKSALMTERALGFCLGWHQAHADRAWEQAKEVVALETTTF